MAGATPQAALVNVSTSTANAAVGGTVTFNFSISGLHHGGFGSLAGFDLDLHCDSTPLQFTGFGFVDASRGTNMLAPPEAGGLGLSGNSTVVPDANPADASGFLTLTFNALQASSGTSLFIDLGDRRDINGDGKIDLLEAREIVNRPCAAGSCPTN